MSGTSAKLEDADRRSILEFVKQMMGPMYNPDKEDDYVNVIRWLRANPPKFPEPDLSVPEETILQRLCGMYLGIGA